MERKKKLLIVLVVAMIAFVAYGLVGHQMRKTLDGADVESREMLLDRAINRNDGENWSIAAETAVDGYLASGACSSDGRSTLAIFKPAGEGKYRVMTTVSGGQNEVITENVALNEKGYTFIWLNNDKPDYVEVTFTVDGQPQPPQRYDTGNMEVICIEAPADEYTQEVVYYDAQGNCYP